MQNIQKFVKKFFILLIFLIQIFFTHNLIYAEISGTQNNDDNLWFKNAVFYQIFVGAFKDSDGDGYGDFNGLTSKLDYIKSLGVDAIYLNPITEPEDKEGSFEAFKGYAVIDFKKVNHKYGTLDDFKQLLDEAHKRNLKIIIDYVTIGVSYDHPFFQDFLKNPNSKYKDWFITKENMSPEEIKQWINFKGKGWYEIENKKFYYSLYGEPDRGEPALNFKNPEVKKYMLSVADYWLKIGVDGFRGDAAKYLYFNGPGKELQEHQPETFEFWRDLKKIMLNYSKDKVLIAEIIPNPVEYDYTGKNRELFDFLYNNNFSESLYDRGVNFRTVTSAKYNSSFKNQNNIHSLIYHSNHDIERIASKLNPEKDKNIELKLVASMLLLSNSTPMLYFGDEIGLAYGDGERNYSALSTMAFDNNKNFGFSTADKIIPPTTVNSQTNNVEIQEKQEDSLLNYSRELIALRHKYNVFANGFMQKHEQIDEKIYSYTLYNNNVSILILHNLSPIDKNIEFDLNKINIKKEYQLTKIFGDYLDNYHIENKKLYIKNFKPYGSLVFKLEGITKTDFDIINPDFENSFLLNFDKKYSTKNQVYKLPTSSEKISITLKIKKPIIIHCYDKKQIQTNIFTIKPNKKNDIIIPFSVDTVFFKIEEQNIHFTINNLDIFDYFEKRTRETIRHNENKTLKSLAYGMDENFWYFKIEKEKFIMPKNSGLDFCMFIHDPNNETGVKEIGFWLLHGIHSKEIINNLLIYQKGLKNDKPILFTNTTQSTQPGINKEEAVIFQETNNALYLAIDKKNMPMNNYKIGLCVWSASGEWGDRAMTQEPIAEMLPYNEEEMKKQYPYHIDLIEIKG